MENGGDGEGRVHVMGDIITLTLETNERKEGNGKKKRREETVGLFCEIFETVVFFSFLLFLGGFNAH